MVVSTSPFQMATPRLLGPQEPKGLNLRRPNFLLGPLERVSRGPLGNTVETAREGRRGSWLELTVGEGSWLAAWLAAAVRSEASEPGSESLVKV